MDVELFIHGVPNGEGFWGNEEERNYFGQFYVQCSDEVKFLIQTRALKKKAYCYYNYLVYKSAGATSPNIVDYDGRDGSYFGISLRLDAYCKDCANMYRILDTIYNVYVWGNLLKMEKTKLKYTTSDFASVSGTLKTIEEATIHLIQEAFSNESFARLDGFALSGSICPTCNLYDCTPDNVRTTIKQYSKLAISPYYPSVKESTIQQQCNAQIQTTQQQFEERLKADADAYIKEKSEIDKWLSSSKNQVTQLQKEITQKEEIINQLEKEVSRLQAEIESIGQNIKIAQMITLIKEPVSELATALQKIISKTSEQNRDEEESKDSLLKKLKVFIRKTTKFN